MRSDRAPRAVEALLVAGICTPFLYSGLHKLLHPAAAMAEMAHFGLPWPALTAVAVVLLQLGASALLVLGPARVAWWGAAALALFTGAATWMAHAFWTFGPAERPLHTNIFFEHVGLCFALLLAGWVRSR